jgi:hypothetical protein
MSRGVIEKPDDGVPDGVLWLFFGLAVWALAYAGVSWVLMQRNVEGGWPWIL